MERKVFFRVDGGVQIGLGHVVRCIAMSQMLQDNYSITFVCKQIPELIKADISNFGYTILEIVNEEEFLTQLTDVDIVVLDHYGFDSFYQKKIQDSNCKLVCIDDYGDKHFNADLIINHAPGVNKNSYSVSSQTKLALGPEYALLRSAFLNLTGKRNPPLKIETIFICFGGSDSQNLTLHVLKVLIQLKIREIVVVTGAGYQNFDSLNEVAFANKNVIHYHNVNEFTLSELMRKADIAIVPASSILFEALASGCLVLTSYYVDNQKNIYEGFKKLRAGYFLESFDEFTVDFASKFISKTHFKQSNPIDGLSGIRIKKLIDNL